MTQLLYWAAVAEKLFNQTLALLQAHEVSWYLAIFLMGENNPSLVYVRKKKEYATKLWLDTKIFSNEKTILQDIEQCNNDKECLWIIIQLPLSPWLKEKQKDLLNAVSPRKDPDCLGEWSLLLPATPAAIMHILAYYKHDDFLEKKISILWESDLIWKPLAQELVRYWSDVSVFNEFSDQQKMREISRESDYIFACTGSLHLVDETFLAWYASTKNKPQVIVDAWWGMIDWKPAGDVNTSAIIDKVQALTPVPWGVWPVTVASLFWNMAQLCTASM